MINAGISEGDLLLIRKQSDVDSGDIAIVNVNGDEETLKRVIKKTALLYCNRKIRLMETKNIYGQRIKRYIHSRKINAGS